MSEQVVENVEQVVEANPQQKINEAFKVCVKRESLETLKNKQESYRRYIEEYTTNLKNYIMKDAEVTKAINAYNDDVDIDFFSKMQEVINNEKIKHFECNITRHTLIATTVPLTMIASNGGRYRLGEMRIEFNAKTCRVRFYCVDDSERRRSYWGDKCHHPHVSNTGEGCLGNSAESIAYLSSEFEFGALFDIFIAYLESINLDDCAGRHAMNWDKVDAEGNIIQEGYRTLNNENFKYGKVATEDVLPDYEKCPVCNKWHRTGRLVTVNDETLCRECARRKYARCRSCDTWITQEEAIEHEQRCTSCYTTYQERLKKERELLDATKLKESTPTNTCELCNHVFEEGEEEYYNESGQHVCKACFSI